MKKIIYIVIAVALVCIVIYSVMHKDRDFESYVSYDDKSVMLDDTFDRDIIIDAVSEYSDSDIDYIIELTNLETYHEFSVVLKDGSKLLIVWEDGIVSVYPVVPEILDMEPAG